VKIGSRLCLNTSFIRSQWQSLGAQWVRPCLRCCESRNTGNRQRRHILPLSRACRIPTPTLRQPTEPCRGRDRRTIVRESVKTLQERDSILGCTRLFRYIPEFWTSRKVVANAAQKIAKPAALLMFPGETQRWPLLGLGIVRRLWQEKSSGRANLLGEPLDP
jgi:hypothetical protein